MPIEGAERLTRIFGEWPTFHDAEVVRLVLDRAGPDGPTIEAQVHVFEMTAEVNAAGAYVLRNHTLATLRFTRVSTVSPADFNRQNVLFDLLISPLDPTAQGGRRFRVDMPSSSGLTGAFECERVVVTDAIPYQPPWWFKP